MKARDDDLEKRVLTLLEEDSPRTNKELREVLFPKLKKGHYAPELDRALQLLRKGGYIRPTSKGWVPTNREQCPTCGGMGWVELPIRRAQK